MSKSFSPSLLALAATEFVNTPDPITGALSMWYIKKISRYFQPNVLFMVTQTNNFFILLGGHTALTLKQWITDLFSCSFFILALYTVEKYTKLYCHNWSYHKQYMKQIWGLNFLMVWSKRQMNAVLLKKYPNANHETSTGLQYLTLYHHLTNVYCI